VPTLFRSGVTNIPEIFYQDVRTQDPLARLFLGVTIATGNYTDQVGIVGNLTMPIALLDGEGEQIANIAYQQGLTIPTLWHNKVWVIPHAGHIAQWENPVYFNVLLAAFVIECNLNS
jgi:pimeloyl-ACP methyl ester carboxylesterase